MTVEENLLRVDLVDLRVRLRDLGWQQVGEDQGLLRSPAGSLARVPQEAPDVVRIQIVRDVFEALAAGDELVSSDDLLAQYLSAVDLLFVGVELPNVSAGLLPIRASRGFYERWQTFLTQAAAAETNYNKKGTNKISASAREFLDRIYWGKTVASSYMQAVHIPVDAVLEPFGRRLWHRVIRCLDSLRVASPTGSVEALLESDSQGWSAPMCEKLAGLIDDVNATAVKAIVRPDRTRKDLLGNEPMSTTATIVADAAVELLMRASLILREIPEASEQTITGLAFELSDPTLVGRDEERSVKIQWQAQDEMPMTVYVHLSPEDYMATIDAHRNRRPIIVKGLLGRSGRRHVLTNYSDFRVG